MGRDALNNQRNSANIHDLSLMAVFIALTCLVTMFFKVPTYIGYVHLGDAMVFLAAILLGKKKGVIAAAFGMLLADVLGGYVIWAPITFVIKGVMALITAQIAYAGQNKGKNIKINTIACIVASIWMVISYYIATALLTMYVYTEAATLKESFFVSLSTSLVPNIFEVVIGMVIAIPLSIVLSKKVK